MINTVNKQKLIELAGRAFGARFDEWPTVFVSTPGRVNLIGDHTDYTGGFALPAAIDRYVVLAASIQPSIASESPRMEVYSDVLGATANIQLGGGDIKAQSDWADHVRGVVAHYMNLGAIIPSLRVCLYSNLPIGAGLSSSAALEIGISKLIEFVAEFELNPMDRVRLCQRAEAEFAGVPCGLLDQMSIEYASAGSASVINFSNHSVRGVTWPDAEKCIVVLNSNVDRALADGEYAKRFDECKSAERLLGRVLSECNEADIEGIVLGEGDIEFRRARHVTTENRRVHEFADAVEMSDWEVAGKLMFESHKSLRNDFNVTCAETDYLVQLAKNIGVDNGVYGARMTGGGFGGSVVMLVERDKATSTVAQIKVDYEARFDQSTDAELVRFVGGSEIVVASDESDGLAVRE